MTRFIYRHPKERGGSPGQLDRRTFLGGSFALALGAVGGSSLPGRVRG